ncbi:MAG: hypothetical protein K2M99_05465, partial [Treponemataceae bacterium]|nr:hypothetical protein [Treponemataceae bacterium]
KETVFDLKNDLTQTHNAALAIPYNKNKNKMEKTCQTSTSPKRFTHRGTKINGSIIAANCKKIVRKSENSIKKSVNGKISSYFCPVPSDKTGIISIETYGTARKK